MEDSGQAAVYYVALTVSGNTPEQSSSLSDEKHNFHPTTSIPVLELAQLNLVWNILSRF